MPVRGMKLTLAVTSARGRRGPALTVRLTSLTRKLGAPSESTLSNAVDARRLAEIGDLAARVDRRGEQVAQEHPADLRRLGEHRVAVVAPEPRAVALRREEAEVDVAGDLDREPRAAVLLRPLELGLELLGPCLRARRACASGSGSAGSSATGSSGGTLVGEALASSGAVCAAAGPDAVIASPSPIQRPIRQFMCTSGALRCAVVGTD